MAGEDTHSGTDHRLLHVHRPDARATDGGNSFRQFAAERPHELRAGYGGRIRHALAADQDDGGSESVLLIL